MTFSFKSILVLGTPGDLKAIQSLAFLMHLKQEFAFIKRREKVFFQFRLKIQSRGSAWNEYSHDTWW